MGHRDTCFSSLFNSAVEIAPIEIVMLASTRSIFILTMLLMASQHSIAGDNKILQLRCKDCFAPRFSSELLDLKGKEYEKRFSESQNPLRFQDSSEFNPGSSLSEKKNENKKWVTIIPERSVGR